MTLDDDDDDVVVPSGSRRSSYVPPAEDSDFVPAMPPVTEPETPTSSTGPLPSIGSAADQQVAQSPSFAESAEILEPEVPVVPSIVIEIPAEEIPVVKAPGSGGLDQFGLPVVDAEPIGIPHVVVSEPIPEALPGTGSVFDDNRLFPAVATGGALDGEVVEDPIVEEFGTPTATEETHEPISENIPETADEPVREAASDLAPLPELPIRQSLNPAGLAEVLGSNGGMSSNDQMALLDAQIPLREADALAIEAFVAALNEHSSPEAVALRRTAAEVFGDLTPELFGGFLEPTAPGFTDDSTPVTGIPVVEHIEIVDVIEDDNGEVVEIDVTEIDEVAVVPAETAQRAAAEDDQAWSLPAPAETVVDDSPTVARRHWWTLAGYGAVVASLIITGFAAVVSSSTAAPYTWLVVAGVAVAIPFLEPARHFHVRTGGSWRSGLESVFGRVPGRVAAGGFAAIVALALLGVFPMLTAGLGAQIEGNDTLAALVGKALPVGAVGPAIAALALLGGAIIAALPFRLYRAKVLTLTGWAVLGSAPVAAMGSFLVLSTQSAGSPNMTVLVAQFGAVASIALVLLSSSLDGFQEVTRIREGRSGGLWLYIGLGLGLLTTAGVVSASLLAQGGKHSFFGNNPALHVVAPSPQLAFILGALAFVPAIVLIAALGFRAIGGATTRDDRESPNTVLAWLLLLVPIALAVVAYLGLTPAVLDVLPSVSVLAVPVAAVLGVLASRGVIGKDVTRRGGQVALIVVTLVTVALGWGFVSGTGFGSSWVGYINNSLRPFGYGLLYIDSVAPIATGVLAFLVGLVVVAISTRRRSTSA